MWLVGTESGSHASLLLGRVAVLLSRSATAEIDINSSTDLSLTSAGGRCELLALGLARLDLGGQIEGASAALSARIHAARSHGASGGRGDHRRGPTWAAKRSARSLRGACAGLPRADRAAAGVRDSQCAGT